MPKSAAQIAYDQLVDHFCQPEQEPHNGYDLSNLHITYEQAAIVLAGEPDVMDGIIEPNAETAHFVAKLNCHPGSQSDELSAERDRDLVRRIVASAKQYLLYEIETKLDFKKEQDALWYSPEPDKYEFAR